MLAVADAPPSTLSPVAVQPLASAPNARVSHLVQAELVTQKQVARIKMGSPSNPQSLIPAPAPQKKKTFWKFLCFK